jgi:hypothetical protein
VIQRREVLGHKSTDLCPSLFFRLVLYFYYGEGKKFYYLVSVIVFLF